jgi:hypothetical protein
MGAGRYLALAWRMRNSAPSSVTADSIEVVRRFAAWCHLRRMSLPQSVRSLIPLIVGLLIGGVGATLFVESMPGAVGSDKERADRLERELKKAQDLIAASGGSLVRNRRGLIERIAGGSNAGSRQTVADGARSIAEDLRDGRPVNPEDIFRASKPLLQDLAPLFDRMRVKQQRQMIDSLTGELARKYNLTQENQEVLKQWFEERSNVESKRWSEMIARDGTRLEDVMRASRDVRPDEGLDTFMEGVLTGDKLVAFRSERIAERAQRVEHEADMKVQRLNSIVGLDEAQHDQVFGIMARTSRDYDPAMVLEGTQGEIGATPGGNRQNAMLSVLRPEQRAAYEAERQRRRDEATKDLEAMGLTLPPNWEMLDDGDFK